MDHPAKCVKPCVEDYLRDITFEESKCFIHGDCHYANILWQKGKVSALLDYELSGYGSCEYDLAWAPILRPGQRFLMTKVEREAVLASYRRYHDFSEIAFNYYSVLFAMFFYNISPGDENKAYRDCLLDIIYGIVDGK